MGGLKPGITTDTVAAIIAQRWRADILVKASDQNGIYTEDPRVNKKAKELDKITYDKMKQVPASFDMQGSTASSTLWPSTKLVESRIRLVVLNGNDPKAVVKAIHGEKIGTVVS